MKRMKTFLHFNKLIFLGVLTYVILPLFKVKGRRFSKRMNKIWFDSLAIVMQGASEESADFMNYGYIDHSDTIIDDIQDTPKNMYLHVATNGYQMDLSNKTVLEVGCGKGAGGELIHNKTKTKSYLGIDLSDEHILMAKNRLPDTRNLSFKQGDAENLPIENEKYDCIINIESSHQYPNLIRFYREVRRVMHNNSQFMYADFFDKNEIEQCEQEALRAGLVLRQKTDITQNVCWALEKTSETKQRKIELQAPKFVQRYIKEWAGTVDSPLYKKLMAGDRSYIHYVYSV